MVLVEVEEIEEVEEMEEVEEVVVEEEVKEVEEVVEEEEEKVLLAFPGEHMSSTLPLSSPQPFKQLL